MSNVFINYLNSTLRQSNYYFAMVITASIISFNVTAANLNLGDNLQLRDIDDKPIDRSFFSQKQEFELTKGSHTLVIKYKDVFEDMQLGDERLVTSDYFVVKFTFDEQQSLFLTTSEINDLAAADLFVKSPELTLRDSNNNELPLVLETLSDYELAKEVAKQLTGLSASTAASVGVLPTTVLVKSEVIAQGAKGLNNQTTVETASEVTSNVKNDTTNEVDAVPMLKYWWQKASKDQKANFLQFINENKQVTTK